MSAAGRPAARLSGPSGLALVFAGGTAGTAARYGLAEVIPRGLGMPLATVAVNLTGALLLGLLLEIVARRGPDRRMLGALRLLLGTGFLGGFTTYSALAVDTDTLIRGGRLVTAMAYAGGTVVLGVVAALIGMALARRLVTSRDAPC